MSILYVGCIKFSTNQFIRNFCPNIYRHLQAKIVSILLGSVPNKTDPIQSQYFLENYLILLSYIYIYIYILCLFQYKKICKFIIKFVKPDVNSTDLIMNL
jgi:hypothetical protein